MVVAVVVRVVVVVALVAPPSAASPSTVTRNLAAPIPLRSTRSLLTPTPSSPSESTAFSSTSNGTPASRSAPAIMSPDAPEKQSR